MKPCSLFLLVYLVGTIFAGRSSSQINEICTFGPESDATSQFLQCVGLPSTDTGRDHIQKLKGMLEATMDVYTFMKSSLNGVPLLSLDGALEFTPDADPLQNEALVQMWVEVKIKPLLNSITKHFLSCLSNKNFSCSTYQTIVGEISQYYSEMNPVRQQWLYSFFMYPFLSGGTVSGCVNPGETSEEWLVKNFGAFRAMARLKDFSTLNLVFSGLEVLHLLSPTQKAELLLSPENFDYGTLTLVFQSLLTGGAASPSMLPSTYNPYSTYYSQNTFTKILSGFGNAFTTAGSFAHEFVSFTSQRNVSEIKATTLTQFLLNFTLAELANVYQTQSTPSVSEALQFDVTSEEDWYQQVVIPVLQTIWPSQEDLMHQNVTLAFHDLFFLYNSVEDNSSEIQDVCSMTLDQTPCGLTDAVENVANVLHCAARSNLTMTETTVLRLMDELTRRLNSLIKELLTANFEELMTDFKEIFSEGQTSSLTQQHLEDPEFIKLWFQIKLMPLLPDVSPDLLSCLSTKNLSCPAYQTLVAALGDYMSLMQANDTYSLNIYTYFIYPFLMNHGGSDPQCWASSASNSTVWLIENFGFFSVFASIVNFYNLNPYFSGLEALPVLSSLQLAEMLLLPLRTPPDKTVVIDQVFDFLLEPPQIQKFEEVLLHVVQLAGMVKPPCNVYIQIFNRMYQAISVLPPNVEPIIWNRIDDLINIAPEACVPMNITCPQTQINMTGSNVCRSVNSSDLMSYLNTHKQVSCEFPLEKYACAQLGDFTANELASLMGCGLTGNSSQSKVLWRMLLIQLTPVLDPALDILANMSVRMIGPSAKDILDVISELRLSQLSDEQLRDSSIIQLWFSVRLRDFLPFASGRFLHCLTMRNISCQSYQQILQVFVRQFVNMPSQQQLVVLKDFILRFLSAPDSGPGCIPSSNSSKAWLLDNFGPFSQLLTISQLINLNHDFNPLDVLELLTVSQLVEVSATLLKSPDQVTMVMAYVSDQEFASFFDQFSLAIIQQNGTTLPPLVRAAFLDVVFNRANLSSPWVSDSVVSQWLQYRLPPLLIGLLPYQVTPYFQILAGRNCSIVQQGVKDLNFTISTLSSDSQQEIYNNILQTLTGPASLRCYGNNYNISFYSFVENSFLGFQFPNLTTFLSLMPQDRKHQLVNSMPLSDLASLLNRPNIVDDEATLCDLYSNYDQTPRFLGTESLPAEVRRLTLPCVWPMALSSNSWSEVNAWFDLGLKNYLVFLTNSLISSEITANASCLAFQKLVLVLGNFNYTAADFGKSDVYNTIRSYLTSASTPKCYNSSDPQLNSTAWFVEYIGPFISFLTLDDLLSFGSEEVLQVFTVNPLNIALINQSALPQDLTDFYTQLIYQQDSNFNPFLLPFICRCVAPALAFTQMTAGETMIVLGNINTVCIDLDPEISAALVSNFGDTIDVSVIAAMGNDSAYMSIRQIIMIKPQDLKNTLSILSTVVGWSDGQADAIIQSLTTSGVFQIDSSFSLISLGSLLVGIPTSQLVSISGAQILAASQNPSVVGYLISAPTVVQQIFVSEIITVDSNSEVIIQNVPDEMATEIPRVLLQGFTGSSSSVVTTLNKKKWERRQAELFFNVIAVETVTTELGSPDNLSSSVLQGFTSTSVRAISTSQIKNLIKACRRTGQNKVPLVETQLTCMYDYISGQPDATSFDLYPPDMLLYYQYSLVPRSSCRFYFQQLSSADFSVFSSVLSYKRTALFENAKSCLGVTNTSLTQDNVSVLGNMCCTLDGSYIVNSDPSILETLKTCPGLTAAQAAAVEALLISGNTKYGVTSSWNLNTLTKLGMLPLYLTSSFYKYFDTKTKRSFLKYFLKVLRANKVSKQKQGKLMEQIRLSVLNRSKRSTVTGCTVGIITQVIISDETFPFDYSDINQFNSCLSAESVKDNLDAITLKVYQVQYLSIVLSKLREAYNFTTIPEYQVQVLGPASRVATVDDISKWTITMIDTLAALMDSSNGQWDPSLAKAIISKYLSVKGNTLGSAELNAIGGPNLCSLDVDVFKNISQQSLRNANALDVSNCTGDTLMELFNIASQAFASTTRTTVSANNYQLLQPYIGGATADYIKSLVAANISMDLATFTSLNQSIVLNLTISEVQALLGSNLPQLKDYENQTLVQMWISNQLQSELNTLNIGLVGGRAGPITLNGTTATPSSAPNTTPPSSSTNITSSPSLSSNTTTLSPSLSSNTTTLSPSLSSNTTTLSPSLSSSTTTISPSLSSNTTTLSPSPSSSTTTLSPSLSSNTTSISPSPSSSTTTLSPSLSSNTTSISPSLSSSTTTLSPSLSSNTTSISPSPSSSTTTLSPSLSSNTTSISPSLSSSTTTRSPSLSSNTSTPSPAQNTSPSSSTNNSPSSSSTTPKSTTSSPTSSASTTKPTSTAAGSHIRTDVGFSFLVIFTLLISSQQVLL